MGRFGMRSPVSYSQFRKFFSWFAPKESKPSVTMKVGQVLEGAKARYRLVRALATIDTSTTVFKAEILPGRTLMRIPAQWSVTECRHTDEA